MGVPVWAPKPNIRSPAYQEIILCIPLVQGRQYRSLHSYAVVAFLEGTSKIDQCMNRFPLIPGTPSVSPYLVEKFLKSTNPWKLRTSELVDSNPRCASSHPIAGSRYYRVGVPERVAVIVKQRVEVREVNVECKGIAGMEVGQLSRIIHGLRFVIAWIRFLQVVQVPVGGVVQEGEREAMFLVIEDPIAEGSIHICIVAGLEREVAFFRL